MNLILLSGGLDSTTALYLSKKETTTRAIGFDYGQRHAIELLAARTICERIEVPFVSVKFPEIFGESALLTTAHISGREPVSKFVVPGRNLAFIGAAGAYAAAIGASTLVVGCNADDVAEFPDCRAEFLHGCHLALRAYGVSLWAPFAEKSKREVARVAHSLRVPISETISCYMPSMGRECGTCDACKKRKAALQ